MHEHPKTAVSWENAHIEALKGDPRTIVAEADLCQFGLRSRDREGEGLAKKPTTFFTNSLGMTKALSHKCKRGHRNVHLMEVIASAGQVYPKGLCRAMVQGTKRQLRVDRWESGHYEMPRRCRGGHGV